MYILFNFFIFGILGWAIENIYSYFIHGHFQKDGFLNLPFKPMYAIAMSVLINFYSSIQNGYIFILLCAIVPTSVEYLTGKIMRSYFNRDYWDYSKCRFSIDGIICLRFSIYWTILTYIGVIYLRPLVTDRIYTFIYPYWVFLAPIIFITLFIDTLVTIRNYKLSLDIK